ncbi:hypothetical protein, partial [Mesorhizobium sp. M5C.F.Ca.IN.020.32.2.1]|uniref:hypothetical protein n=1 Tax=Mesorhizobium sp. M5C.F.Ca.IN.020.32.2.1 TaxID=2496771 RepID=UPI0019D41B58
NRAVRWFPACACLLLSYEQKQNTRRRFLVKRNFFLCAICLARSCSIHDSQAVISQAERRAAPRRQNGMLDHSKLMIEQNPDTAPRQIEFFAARD